MDATLMQLCSSICGIFCPVISFLRTAPKPALMELFDPGKDTSPKLGKRVLWDFGP